MTASIDRMAATSARSVNFTAVVVSMMRLLMEAVMVIAIVSGMVFVSKMGTSDDKQPKDTKKREDHMDIKDDDWPYR